MSVTMLTLKEAAKMLMVSEHTLYKRYPPYNTIPYVKMGKFCRYSKENIQEFIDVSFVGFTNIGKQIQESANIGKQIQTNTNIGKENAVTEQKVLKSFIYYCFNDREFKNIEETDIEKWNKAYPAVDIKSQLLRAGLWLDANPSKTKKNYRRFLTNWFSRSQERGGDLKSNQIYISKSDALREHNEAARKKCLEMRKTNERL